MIKQNKYRASLFVFNDNEQQFIHGPNTPGAGNAAIRPYKSTKPPRAWGIPTGPNYTKLTPKNRSLIDAAVRKIFQLAQEHGYKEVIYSSDKTGRLGSGIFVISDDVNNYIICKLESYFKPQDEMDV